MLKVGEYIGTDSVRKIKVECITGKLVSCVYWFSTIGKRNYLSTKTEVELDIKNYNLKYVNKQWD